MTTASFASLAERIETLASTPSDAALPDDAESVVAQLLAALERGEVRSAERDSDGTWHAVPWVKRGILLGFRAGRVVPMPDANGAAGALPVSFFDKHTIPPRVLTLDDGVRVVPGGTSIRRGSYVAPGVVCMPPVFINVGAYVGAGTMVDSHALVGSCAQIGDRVHLSAGVQIGGVLEPINATPVIIESDAIVGGNSGVYEGTIVRSRAVLGAGSVLTRGTPVYDLVRERVYRAESGRPLEIPEGAVVVPGARAVRGAWAGAEGLSVQTPLIVKYRDEKTDLATALEQWLR
ncbi:MAG TPA: 2,3,4,5-tetrahydropyridine-2,6-dicarboxylate N-succinyltransferase [Gemmatimonadaceae bacterium]|nr:2,3,4,5-tetrahydropyridine-2,6-dicarboxylate N-succinyltransferase [Gemmatimonadaceae bacterium]